MPFYLESPFLIVLARLASSSCRPTSWRAHVMARRRRQQRGRRAAGGGGEGRAAAAPAATRRGRAGAAAPRGDGFAAARAPIHVRTPSRRARPRRMRFRCSRPRAAAFARPACRRRRFFSRRRISPGLRARRAAAAVPAHARPCAGVGRPALLLGRSARLLDVSASPFVHHARARTFCWQHISISPFCRARTRTHAGRLRPARAARARRFNRRRAFAPRASSAGAHQVCMVLCVDSRHLFSPRAMVKARRRRRRAAKRHGDGMSGRGGGARASPV